MKDKYKQYENRLIKGVLKGSVNSTVWLLTTMIVSGKVANEIFLKKPTYCPRDPWEVIREGQKVAKELINKAYLRKSIKKLQKYGIVEEKSGVLEFTKKGVNLAKRIMGYKNVLDKKWDGKYRIVIFDIPEKQRKDRNWLRGELYFLKYKQLQKSVFISKFPLTPEIIKEIKKREIDKGVNYILAEKIYDIQKMKNLDYDYLQRRVFEQ